MNNLSWLIYWADAAPSVSRALCITSFLAFIVSIILVVLGFTGFFGDEDKFHDETRYHRSDFEHASFMAPRYRKLWSLPIVAFLLWIGTFLVPSKDTFYLIAASEAGEQTIQTPEFTKIRAVINKWLDGQVTPEAVNEEPSNN